MQTLQGLFRYFKKDALAGVIVFLIALPLCLGIAQASGAPLFSGIVSGVIGGVVVGFLSESSLSVSGPAAGLIAITVTALQSLMPPGGDPVTGFQYFLCAVMIAGAIQFLLGIIKAGSIASYFPSNVIEGMLAGIGLTIIIKEIPKAVGYVKPLEAAGMEDADNGFNWSDITESLQHISPGAIIISLLGLLILGLWMTKGFKRVQLIPAGLLVVAIGTVLNEVFRASMPSLYLNDAHLVRLPVPKSGAEFLGQLRMPLWNGFLKPEVWKLGAIIAIVASIETLLCIEATDKLDPMKRYTSGNAELRAQGIGNMLSGLIGGLPITSVIVRSSANVNAGAKSKLATIMHGLALLLCVALIPAMLNHIPKAALSAILIFTGYRLCRPSVFRHMWKEGGVTQFIPFVATAVCVYWLNLLEGVAIGLAVSVIFMLRQNMRIPYYYQRSSYSNGDLIKLTLAQEVSFLNKASIKETLEKLPDGCAVIIDASETGYIDFDVLDLIRDFAASKVPVKKIRLSLIGFKDVYRLPGAESERAVMNVLMGANEAPKLSSGGHKELLIQLNKNEGNGTNSVLQQ